ncbi:MAG TPA: hypothetical protein VFU11_08670 [Solirubrobacterales bacterium]|nr:hypothetical protein [Solirubrobacterales bacterium]
MGEEFRLLGEPAELGLRLEKDFGWLDEFSDADDLHRVLDRLQLATVLECPKGLGIIVYPSAAEEADVALVTVFSTAKPEIHVIAGSEELCKLADRDLWEGPDNAALTVSVIEGVIGLANGAIAAVRTLEERGADRTVTDPARCPRCGGENGLRFEYRYVLLGISRTGAPVLSEGGELTDIFCFACGEEVDDVLGPEGPVLAAPRGGRRA